MFSGFSAVFWSAGFVFGLAVHYFVAYLVSGSLISKPGNGCVSVRCNYLLISLPLLTKQQREIAKLCVKRALRCWRLFFPLKRNETKLILHENMDTLCEKPPWKNWVLCLKITKEGLPWPVWGSHSLTLIISCGHIIPVC